MDLSRAQFEQFWTDGDVDNPESVNMVRAYGGTSGVLGRGVTYAHVATQLVLLSSAARAHMAPADLRFCRPDGTCDPLDRVRMPSEYVLDIMAIESSPLTPGYEVAQQNSPRCVPWTSTFYDRAPAPLQTAHDRRAISRRSLGRTPAGNEILQRTKNSARDLELAEPLRRSLDK